MYDPAPGAAIAPEIPDSPARADGCPGCETERAGSRKRYRGNVCRGEYGRTAPHPPIWFAAVIVGAFAIFHGHAHGTELPNAANALAYSFGFVIATGLLHLSGIAFGLLTRWPAGKVAVQAGGGVIALAGIGFLTGVV